jgi:hypothetical protein
MLLHNSESCKPGNLASVVADYRLEDWDLNADRGRGFFLYPLHSDQRWGPPSLLYIGYCGPFSRGKPQLQHGANHSPPFGAKVKKE